MFHFWVVGRDTGDTSLEPKMAKHPALLFVARQFPISSFQAEQDQYNPQ